MAQPAFNWRNILEKEAATSRIGELLMCKIEFQWVDRIARALPEVIANGIRSWENYIVGFSLGGVIRFRLSKNFLRIGGD